MMFVTSLNDVTIVCFPLPVGKPCTYTGEPCQLACIPASIPPGRVSTAMHGPSRQFRIPNFDPVTYISDINLQHVGHWKIQH